MTQYNYSLRDQTFTWDAVPLQGVKSFDVAPVNDRFDMMADNSSGDVLFVEKADHKLREITFTTEHKAGTNTILQLAATEGSTGVFAHFDGTGTQTILVKGKLMKTKTGASNDPVDREWKVIGELILETE